MNEKTLNKVKYFSNELDAILEVRRREDEYGCYHQLNSEQGCQNFSVLKGQARVRPRLLSWWD